jgi:threonine aldolase
MEGTSFLHEPEANIIFAGWPRAGHQRLHDAGAQYYVIEGTLEGDDPDEILTARLVCDWSVSDENIDRFLALVRG